MVSPSDPTRTRRRTAWPHGGAPPRSCRWYAWLERVERFCDGYSAAAPISWTRGSKRRTTPRSPWRVGAIADHRARGDAHAAYIAALDREAHAAEVLRRRLELIRGISGSPSPRRPSRLTCARRRLRTLPGAACGS